MAKNNQCVFEGRLVRDLEISTYGTLRVGKTSIAVDDRFKQGDDWVDAKNSPYFLDLEIFGNKLDEFDEVAKKGVKVKVETQIRIDAWEDKATGAKRTKPVFKIWSFEVLALPKGKEVEQEKPTVKQKPKQEKKAATKAEDVPF